MPFDGTLPRDERPERYERELVQAIMAAERAFLMWQRLGVDVRAATASPEPGHAPAIRREQTRMRGKRRSPERKPPA